MAGGPAITSEQHTKKCPYYLGAFAYLCGHTTNPGQGGAVAYPQRAFGPLATIN